MKFQQLSLALVTVIGCSSAYAFDGTINITGKVIQQTCRVKTESKNLTVQLPDVGTASLAAANQTAATTPFTVKLEACTVPSGDNAPARNVSIYFDAGGTQASTRLKNTATNNAAGNVEVQLLNKNMSPIDLSKTNAAAQSSIAETINGADTSFNYYVRYFATAAATTGNVTSRVNYTVVYN